jgi:hypothetical protein
LESLDRLKWPPTVGDAALTAIRRIAGRRFDLPSPDNHRLTGSSKRRAAKPLIAAWYADVEARGVKAVLIDAVRRGDGESHLQAARLVKLHPTEAAEPIIAGIKQCTDSLNRQCLMWHLKDAPHPSVEPFLLATTSGAEDLEEAVLAAKVLSELGTDRWVPTLIRRWNELPLGVAADELRSYSTYNDVKECAEMLFFSGESACVRALSARLREMPLRLRAEIVRLPINQGWKVGKLKERRLQPKSDYEQSMVELLVVALDDDREQSSQIPGCRELRRIADIAAEVLDELFKKVSFDFPAELPERNRQIAAIKAIFYEAPSAASPNQPARKPTAVTPD